MVDPTVVFSHGYDRLHVRMVRKQEQRLLFLHRESHDVPLDGLKRLGLTTREREVVFWLVRGKSNPEIAQIIESQPTTIQKHLGSIYQKLGVENRTAAVAMVLGLTSQGD